MATTSNKLIPIVAAVGMTIVGVVLYKQFAGDGSVKAGAEMTAVPTPQLPKTDGADNDTPIETLRTVTTSNAELRSEVAKVIKINNDLIEENRKLRERERGGAAGAAAQAAVPAPPAPAPAPAPERSPLDSALDTAAQAADSFTLGLPSLDAAKGKTQNPQAGAGAAGAVGMADEATVEAAGAVRYSVLPPMGYAVQTEPARGQGQNAPPMTRYVRTLHTEGPGTTTAPADGPASQAARAAQDKREPVPYFTLPENATLAGATAMTALIGRVPIDGRVTDPMQFKAVIGRDNLAANGFELPGDVSGMIVTGVAIGDMALSCSEGRVRSVTFVFNDGSIQTVSARGAGSRSINTGAGASSNSDLGFISDLHGNPCITGKFVTNAPAYLTDLIGLGALGVAGQAYSEAQRTTYSGMQGSSSTITGSAGSYALGQAVAGGTNEVSKWLLQRLKNSFDAVITPSGHQLVVHLDREIQIDKAPNARKLIHRKQGGLQLARGEHHGLE